MKRKRLTALQRTRIYDAASGVCCICSGPISFQPWILEHVKPLWLGGADDDSNIAPAHVRCAIEKTRGEAPIKAKSDRQRAKHLGIRKKSRFPGSRDSGLKKKLNGEVVRR